MIRPGPRYRAALAGLLVLVVIAGCERDAQLTLPGVRFDTDVPLADTVTQEDAGPVLISVDANSIDRGGPAPITLPATVNHASWTHRNGGVTHRIQHPALSLPLQPVWSVPIGQGDTRRHRITSSPVAEAGRIFTLDSMSTLVATDANTGAALWSRSLSPASDRARDASGGKVSVAGDTVYATTGFGDLYALDVATGRERWRQRMDAPMGGGVTVSGGIVYTVSRDGRAWALDARDGRILWDIVGSGAPAVLVGGPSPVITDRLVVFPFSNGDLVGALKNNGIRVWQASVSGQAVGRAGGLITDVTGDPVVDGGVIYAGNFGGRTVAVSASSGERLWTARNGALGPVWPAGGSLFMVSDENRLVRLDAATGELIWLVDLPFFVKGNKRPDRWREVYVHYGPVLAGGRLWLGASDGALRGYDPVSGALVAQTDLPGGAASAPIVVNGVLYVVSRNGRLNAFR